MERRATRALRPDEASVGVRENQSANAIAIVYCKPAKERCGLRGDNRFERDLAAKKHARALIYRNNHRTFALFAEDFGNGTAGTCSGAPVDQSNIVTGLIRAKFFEIDTSAAYLG